MRALAVVVLVLLAVSARADDIPLKAKRVAWSASICYHREQRDIALHEIAAKKRYAQLGGVLDRAAILELQGSIEDNDDIIRGNRASLRAAHLTALPCTDAVTKVIAECMDEDVGDHPMCHVPAIAATLGFLGIERTPAEPNR